MANARSPFRDFENFLRIVVGLNEDDIQLILKQWNSFFITYELSVGIYTIIVISEAVFTLGDHEETQQIDYDGISMKTKRFLTRFGRTFGTLRLDKDFLNTVLGFEAFWDYKATKSIPAHSPDVYSSDEILNLSTINKIHLKCDIYDGSLVNGIRDPVIF